MSIITRVDFTGMVVTDGKPVFARVSGYYELRRDGFVRSWDGELTVESGEAPFLFKGQLITDDGKQGNCFGSLWTPGEKTIAFQGCGDIK
jgi:hypothetical protein